MESNSVLAYRFIIVGHPTNTPECMILSLLKDKSLENRNESYSGLTSDFRADKIYWRKKTVYWKEIKSSHRDEQKIFENIMVWQGSFIHHILFMLTCSLYFPSPRKLLYEGDWSCYLPEFFFIKQWNMYSYYFDKSAFYYLLTSLKMNKIETLDQGILVNQNNILRVWICSD